MAQHPHCCVAIIVVLAFQGKTGKWYALKTEELEMLQTGEINAETVAKYKPFIDRLFSTNVCNTQTKIKTSQIHEPFFGIYFDFTSYCSLHIKTTKVKDILNLAATMLEFYETTKLNV